MDIDMKIKKRLDYCAIFQGQFFHVSQIFASWNILFYVWVLQNT